MCKNASNIRELFRTGPVRNRRHARSSADMRWKELAVGCASR